jgi:hypothetical protein
MDRRLQYDSGKILGLLNILRDHGEAVEYELLRVGKRLDDIGTEALSWHELWIVAINAPPKSPLHISIAGDAAFWSIETYIFASILDALNNANWQRGGGKGMRPTPVKRPQDKQKEQRFGSEPILITEFDEWWDSN